MRGHSRMNPILSSVFLSKERKPKGVIKKVEPADSSLSRYSNAVNNSMASREMSDPALKEIIS